MSRRDSAAIVPKTSEDLPEPDTPVNTDSRRFGMSTDTSARLFSRAPRTRMTSWLSAWGSVATMASSSRMRGTLGEGDREGDGCAVGRTAGGRNATGPGGRAIRAARPRRRSVQAGASVLGDLLHQVAGRTLAEGLRDVRLA